MLLSILSVALASVVEGHGFVESIFSNGISYRGFNPAQPNQTSLVSWTTSQTTDYDFIPSTFFNTTSIICHRDATPAPSTIPVPAGENLTLSWAPKPWTTGHHGPVLTYLASCNGSCSSITPSLLKFVKIQESGLLAPTPFPGLYASSVLRDNNSTWTVTIPKDIKGGEYVLRHEIFALHIADKVGGAQSYPQCVNLNVTGGGIETRVGIGAEEFYGEKDPGVLIDIWGFNGSYVIPGPKLWEGWLDSVGSNRSVSDRGV